jgi:hypothetical protein
MKRFFQSVTIFIVFGATCFPVRSQVFEGDIIIKDDSTTGVELISAITNSYKETVLKVNGRNSKQVVAIYDERFVFLKEKFTKGEIITGTKESGYLRKLVKKITEGNPFLGHLNIRPVFSRSFWPNASSIGEGTIIFNIGLFSRLDNEAQVVFILCHELAHLYLDHGNKAIHEYVNTVYSKEFQGKLKSIKKEEYGKREKFEKLTKELAFKNRRHGREHEYEADSMALVLMKNTMYDVGETLNCLSLLDTVDTDKYNNNLNLDKWFNFSSFPFKRRWLDSDEVIMISDPGNDHNHSKISDSLKTHPDCASRISALSDEVKRYSGPGRKKFIVDQGTFTVLKSKFDYEILEYCFRSLQISRCLFFSLEMLASFPQNAYLHAQAGRCLNNIYLYQKNQELSSIADLPSPQLGEKYNSLLNFIQNIRLDEIAGLAYFFLKENQDKFSDNEDFLYALIVSKGNFKMMDEYAYWLNFYKQKFPNGKYSFKPDNK